MVNSYNFISAFTTVGYFTISINLLINSLVFNIQNKQALSLNEITCNNIDGRGLIFIFYIEI